MNHKVQRPEGWRTGRFPEAYVRFQRRKSSKGRDTIELQLGRAVWYALGKPERVSLEWHGDEIRIVPDAEQGWKLWIRPYGVPRCWLPLDIEIAPGRYTAMVYDGAIVVGTRERD